MIGGGDWSEDRLILIFLEKYRVIGSEKIRSPRAVRPWQHVLEPLFGYLKLAQNLFAGKSEFATSWNFGSETNDNRTVEEICQILISKNRQRSLGGH